MATATDQLSGLSNLLNLVNSVQGKSGTQKTTTTGTQTTASNISDEGVARVVQQILAGPGGVKDISGAARGAGLYNSSTESQLLNDLTARTAGEVEKQRAGTTTTTSGTQATTMEMPGTGIGGLGSLLGAGAVAKPLLGGLSSLIQGKGFMQGTGLAGLLGSTGGAVGTAGLTGGAIDLGATLGSASDMTGAAGGTSGFGSVLGDAVAGSVGSVGMDLFGSLAPDLGNLVASPALDLGATLGTSLGDFANVSSSFGMVPGVGNFLSGLLSGGDNMDNPLSIGTAALTGAATMGPVGLLLGPALGLLGGGLGSISIICTALMHRGLLDVREYAAGQLYLDSVSVTTKAGYYFMAEGVANKILNGNKFWTAVCLPFARQRTKLIAQGKGWKRWVRYPLGSLTRWIGQPICWCVGKAIELVATLHATRYTVSH